MTQRKDRRAPGSLPALGGLALLVLLLVVQPAWAAPDEPTLTLRATDAHASEWGPDPGEVTIFLSFPVDHPLTVRLAIGGTARPRSDYVPLERQLVIPAGTKRVKIPVIPIDDLKVEGDETVVVELQHGAGYRVGSPRKATVVIRDDDTPVRIADNHIGHPWLYLWDPLSGKLFAGANPTAPIVAFFDINRNRQEGYLHAGANVTGDVLFFVDFRTGRIYDGPNTSYPLLYTLESVRSRRGLTVRVHLGSQRGPIIYTVELDDFHRGPRVSGPLVYHGSRPFDGPVFFLLPLLTDGLIPLPATES